MCGRFNLRTSVEGIVQQFLPGITQDHLPPITPRYNIAPTQLITCVMQSAADAPRRLSLLRWGLLPVWAKDAAIGSRMINARSETIAEKPAFRTPFKSRRCLIPADGYYEWKLEAEGKQPYEFFRRDGKLLALAGLWESNKFLGSPGAPLLSCTIITTTANEYASDVHDRMPVILEPQHWDQWLDPAKHDSEALQKLLQPAAEDLLDRRPVSKRLNNVRHQGADVLSD